MLWIISHDVKSLNYSLKCDPGLKVQKENLLEAKRLAKEDDERVRIKHDKEMKELEKVHFKHSSPYNCI